MNNWYFCKFKKTSPPLVVLFASVQFSISEPETFLNTQCLIANKVDKMDSLWHSVRVEKFP